MERGWSLCWERRCLLPFCLRREQRAPGTALVPPAVCGGLRAAGRSHRVAGVELPGFFSFSGAALALGVLAAVLLALMVYTLFFALPFSATYLEAPRKAYTGSMLDTFGDRPA